jgi:DNA-binding NarL/FixJ family response regulator
MVAVCERRKMPIMRILIADDHDLMRRGLKALIETRGGWTVCAEATTGREAVELAKKFRPEVAVLDITMPELNGIETARRIRKASRGTEVLMLSTHYSDRLVREVIETGARGYVVKSDSDRDLLIAIETLSKHKPFFTPLATEAVLNNFGKAQPGIEDTESEQEPLSSREREILQLLSEGRSSKEVASALDLSVKTAETHRANIMRKLKVHNVTELVRYAVRNSIIEP